MNFIIPKFDFDFQWVVADIIKFVNWWNKEEVHTINKEGEGVPVGSVEFVQGYYGKKIRPINIPFSLNTEEYLNRKVEYGSLNTVKERKFVKSDEIIKGDTRIFLPNDIKHSDEIFMISDEIKIESEYRFFVYKKEIVGCKHYSGDWELFPNFSLVKSMISDYKDQPEAYTLDVAIHDGKTSLIEVHDFFSCGLYGFHDPVILKMLISTHEKLSKGKYEQNTKTN